ncbi:MAG TPA: DUF5658 family protein [Candidatus Eisenbacteria bacterium]|nr:DUF5658 family protein [Candidatus Eisenbacteria bacterium]
MPKVPEVRWRAPRVRLIVLLYALLIVFNGFDAHSTLDAVRLGAVELNPVMAALLTYGPWVFILAKMGLACGFGLVLAYWSRRHRLAWYGLIGVTAIYGSVFIWQVALVFFGEHLSIVIPS